MQQQSFFFGLNTFDVVAKFCYIFTIKKVKPATIAGFGQHYVGKTGFEPATPWSQTRCATGLRYFPGLFKRRAKIA